MARKQTNDNKREEMRLIVAEVLGSKGWSRQNLALHMGVTPSAVSSWATGKSMGTNSQRAYLADLTAYDAAALRAELERRIEVAKASIEEAREALETQRSKVRSEAVNGVYIHVNDWQWQDVDFYRMLRADPETGAAMANEVQFVRVKHGRWEVGDYIVKNEASNIYTGHFVTIARAEKFLATVSNDLAAWLKKNA